ncbi:MAG TPA: hypothetical protein VGQ59_10765 [Cyclobacteriaceae bacterium]|jgi:tetratricopeptide (TPR) repeat protein|nr:hypothetical protein [Cyclobacteriaceae bacterium]
MKNLLDLIKMQYKNVGITAVLTLIIIPSFAQDAEIKNAEDLIDEDKRKQAVQVLQKATTTYPTSAKVFYYLGQAQLYAGDQNGAKASFEAGIKADPKEPLNYAGQGHILVLEKKGPQAKLSFDKALGLGKKNVANLQAIAKGQIADKALSKEALPLLQKAKEINPNDFKTALLLGDYYLLENQGGSCASAYEDAEVLNPSSGWPSYKHALLFMRTKNLPVVEEDLKKSITANQKFALAYKELARLYYLKNDGKNAVKNQETYLSLTDSPEDDDLFKLAFYYFSAKDYVKANVEFKKLAAKPNVTPMTLRFYAQSLTEAGELSEAEKTFKTYMETKKDSVKATDYINLARLQKKQNKDSLWAISLETAASMDKNQLRPLEELAAYYFKAKKYELCAIACSKINKIKKQPDANVYFMQGKALIVIKQYQSADTAFAKVIELKPTFVQGYLWAAKSKNAQDGKLDEKDSKVEWLAKPNYDKVIELGEQDRENNKKELVEAYFYSASYNAFKQDFPKAKEALKKILEITPDDASAKEFLKSLDQPAPQQKPKKK